MFDTGHAYIFKAKDGTQILMHLGIDSINLVDEKGKEVKIFEPNVKAGKKLNKSTKIVTINNSKLNKYAKSNITPIFALNETLNGRKINVIAKGNVKKGDPLFVIE